MNYMPEIAKLLGVKIGEEFRLSNSEYIYKIVDNGLLRKNKPIETWYYDNSMLRSLLSGEIEIIKLPKPILTDKEKEDLSGIIRLFRDEVISICKFESMRHCGYEFLSIKINNNVFKYEITLPYFKKWAMYKGMKLEKEYSLEELGL